MVRHQNPNFLRRASGVVTCAVGLLMDEQSRAEQRQSRGKEAGVCLMVEVPKRSRTWLDARHQAKENGITGGGKVLDLTSSAVCTSKLRRTSVVCLLQFPRLHSKNVRRIVSHRDSLICMQI
jgi:hypothetical protein